MSNLAAKTVQEVRERFYAGMATRKVALPSVLPLQLSKLTRAQLFSC